METQATGVTYRSRSKVRGKFKKIAGRVWFYNEELQRLQVEVEKGVELAIKAERK